ncbi:MAG: DUF6249 domain-containing protein, partial [Cyclobacteriaceae bacterium]
GLTFYYMTKALTDYYLRKKMVEKGLDGEDAAKILAKDLKIANKYSSLKWGLIILFGGIGLVLIEILVDFREASSLPFGILAISISVGFLIYYFIMKNSEDKEL